MIHSIITSTCLEVQSTIREHPVLASHLIPTLKYNSPDQIRPTLSFMISILDICTVGMVPLLLSLTQETTLISASSNHSSFPVTVMVLVDLHVYFHCCPNI